MLVDHGLMQNTVGLLYGHAEDLQPKAYRHLEKLVLCVSPDFLIYYDIPVELALERIRIRNRKNSGRLDSESDDNIVKKNLLLLDRLFKRASGLISLWGEFYHIKYDHEYTTKQICENLKLNEIWSQKQFLYFIIDKGVFSNILFDFAMMGVVVDVIIFFFFLKKNNFNSWANPSMLLLFSFLIVNFQSFLDCRLGYRSSESFLFPGVLGFCIILGSIGVASFVLGFISRTPDSIVKNKLNSSCCSQKYSMTLPIILQFSFFILFLMTVNVRDLVSGSAYSGGVNKERSIADYFEALLYVTNAVIVVMVVKKNGVCKVFSNVKLFYYMFLCNNKNAKRR